MEIASQYSVEKRDAASQRGRKRKPHPISQANAGTRFSEGYGLRTRWGCHKAAKRGLKKMVLSEVNFNVGGGTIILVSQKINPSMGKLRRGLVTDIG